MEAFPCALIAPADARYSRRSEASLVLLRDGSVLCAYASHCAPGDTGYDRPGAADAVRYAGGSLIERDNDLAGIAAVRLDGRGQPLASERLVVPPPPGGLNSMSPALRRLPDGRIGMLYSHRQSTRIASRRFICSADEGASWSPPTIVAEGGYRTGCHDRFTVLSTGRLLAPCHGSEDFDAHYLRVWVYRSDDGGVSWLPGDPIALPQVGWPGEHDMESGCNEPGVVERGDGSLLITLRTAMGTQFCAESFDGGQSWTSPRSLEVVSPNAPAHLSRLPGSDDLLLIWTPNYDARQPMNGHRHTLLAGVSRDGGRSWPRERRRVLIDDPTRNSDYPAVHYHGDEVWMVYRRSDHPRVIQGRMSTALMRVPLAWFNS
jgi:sialidase-1